MSDFHRSLHLLDAEMLVAGSMIGSGIFMVSAGMRCGLCVGMLGSFFGCDEWKASPSSPARSASHSGTYRSAWPSALFW